MSEFFSPSDVAELKRAFLTTLTDTCDILAPPDPNTAPRNSSGFPDRTLSTEWLKLNGDTPEPCSVVQGRTGSEQLGAAEVQAESFVEINFATTTTGLTEQCRITIVASRDNPALVGNTYDVIEVSRESIEALQTARCTLVRPT